MDDAGDAREDSAGSSGTVPEAYATPIGGKLGPGATGDAVTCSGDPDACSSPELGTTPETGAAAATPGTGIFNGYT